MGSFFSSPPPPETPIVVLAPDSVPLGTPVRNMFVPYKATWDEYGFGYLNGSRWSTAALTRGTIILGQWQLCYIRSVSIDSTGVPAVTYAALHPTGAFPHMPVMRQSLIVEVVPLGKYQNVEELRARYVEVARYLHRWRDHPDEMNVFFQFDAELRAQWRACEKLRMKIAEADLVAVHPEQVNLDEMLYTLRMKTAVEQAIPRLMEPQKYKTPLSQLLLPHDDA